MPSSTPVSPSPSIAAAPAPARIDARGPRFAAVLTTVVLAVVLITGSGWLLAAQTLVFALGALGGLGRSPYGWLYRTFVRPRLGPPTELEDAAPPRFAQAVGLGFALVGTVGYLSGATWLGLAATALALAAAFLNAAFGYCLGCEVYLLLRRGQHWLRPAGQ
ncbi:DUF4395 domain-containing protein [Streptacidiphilus sp. P02-A3a]|uniref:DUF4395 domain-containing protein n=1 Tax=Streptacidiphilus sp. P02-A3a TaxID=2704468 RepID=UPI0015F7E896|nr:DUF4395 domain-containing protein [Streptacidiphilus sp. P02-A3a]QMU70889.1 DUF4395 domain-containing protein [Streptacidiphilus sp. P02-A3a]